MSLILDALRKLEREKAARDPGVLVVGSVPWGATSRARRLGLVAAGAGALALAGLIGWLLRPGTPPAPVIEAPSAPLPTPAPPAAATPSPQPTPLAPAAATRDELEAAPPIQLARPLPAPAPRLTSSVAPQAAPPVEAAAETPPTSLPVEQPVAPAGATALPEPVAAERISIAPSAAGEDAAPAPPADGLRLHAISQRDGRPVALINDRMVFEGDSFDGVRVLRIGDAEVEVEVRGERRVLRF